MQSKTSFFNMTLFKKNISRTWIVGLLYFVILLLILPVSFIINTAHTKDDWYSQLGYTMEMRLYDHMSNIPTTPFAIVVAIVVTAITFWYLFNKRDNYMMHSFPVSRKSLYFTGVLSSMVVSCAPVVLVSLIMSGAVLVKGAMSLSSIWYWALIVIVSTFLFISIAMFSLMISGQLITGVLFYFIFNFLYLLMDVAFRLMASILMFGMSSCLSELIFNIWSPVAFIFINVKVKSSIVTNMEGTKVVSFTHELAGAEYLVGYTIAAVVLLVVSFILYKYKKLETVQDFISTPFIKPIFSVGMSFFISMVAGAFVAAMIDAVHSLSYNASFTIAIISALIFGIIIYFATQMLIEKTLRVFCLKKAFYCLIYTMASLVVLLCIRFDVFTVEDYVPDAKDIAWAGINNEYTMVFTDAVEIESVRELHENFLADKKELRDISKTKYTDMPTTVFSIKYKLKDGRTITRDYDVVDVASDEVSSNYVAATKPILDFLNDTGRIKEHIIGNIWDDCDITYMSFSTYVYNENKSDFDSWTVNFDDQLNDVEKQEKFKRVYEQLLKDIDAGGVFVQSFKGYEDGNINDDDRLYNDFDFTVYNKDVIYFSDSQTYWDDDYAEDYPTHEQSIYVPITSKCTNTLKALKEEGFYNSDDEIVTLKEYNDKMGYVYDDDSMGTEMYN